MCRQLLLFFLLIVLMAPNVGHSDDDLESLIPKIKPSIVAIGSLIPSRRPPLQVLGTGFAVADGGYLATNYHVVNRELLGEVNERLVAVTRAGGKTVSQAVKLVRVDKAHDLAVLQIEHRLPAVTLSQSIELVAEGKSVAITGFPIGNILGLYPATHTGVISALVPSAETAFGSNQLTTDKIKRLRELFWVYQMDLTAYPGNSGSPVYRVDTGQVIGILNKVFVKAAKEDILKHPSGISYAIPVKHLKELLRGL